jgi:hypothetical protein
MKKIDLARYIEWIQNGRSFSEVRKDLLIQGFTDDEATTIIKHLDDSVLEAQRSGHKSNLKIVAVIMIFIGVTATLISFLALEHTVIIPSGLLATGTATWLAVGRKNTAFHTYRLRRRRYFRK